MYAARAKPDSSGMTLTVTRMQALDAATAALPLQRMSKAWKTGIAAACIFAHYDL